MERIEPKISVDASGNVTWLSTIIDYDPSLFFRGKTVTNEEFNGLFLQQAYQGNYTADSLSAFLEKYLRPTIHRTFTSTFNLLPSYIKTFTSLDWGEKHEDGYYYIIIPAEEHGFMPDTATPELDCMNIDTEVYLMDSNGQFFEVSQVETDKDNTVTIYTDDNTISGFAVIRTNDKAYALTTTSIDASQVDGLHAVATSGKYTDLIDINGPTGPNTRIAQNAVNISSIIDGDTVVAKAKQAEYTDAVLLNSTIQGIPVSNIFEEGSSYVKNATHATHATVAQYASDDTTKGTIEQRLTDLGFKNGTYTQTANVSSEYFTTSGWISKEGKRAYGSISIYPGERFGYFIDDSTLLSSYGYKIGEVSIKPSSESHSSIWLTAKFLDKYNALMLNTMVGFDVVIHTNGEVCLRNNTGYDYFYRYCYIAASTSSSALNMYQLQPYNARYHRVAYADAVLSYRTND